MEQNFRSCIDCHERFYAKGHPAYMYDDNYEYMVKNHSKRCIECDKKYKEKMAKIARQKEEQEAAKRAEGWWKRNEDAHTSIIIAAIAVVVILSIIIVSSIHNSRIRRETEAIRKEAGITYDANSVKCPSCGRTFTDKTNKDSISRRNMCDNCYNNMVWAEKATGKG